MKSYEESIREKRTLLKSSFPDIDNETYKSHQQKGIPPPPLEKPYPKNAPLIELIKPKAIQVGSMQLKKAITQRESRRKYTDEPLTLEELSFLLWATQGIRSVDKNQVWTRRTVPSAGARHPFETYLVINRVTGLKPAVYRYLPLEHKLLVINHKPPTSRQISNACWGQTFVSQAAAVFIWTTVPYRAEWRYSVIAYKGVAVDAGHICQNLYLACEAIGAGACAILAYNQEETDALIDADGEEEFTVYLAPVGKVKRA